MQVKNPSAAGWDFDALAAEITDLQQDLFDWLNVGPAAVSWVEPSASIESLDGWGRTA